MQTQAQARTPTHKNKLIIANVHTHWYTLMHRHTHTHTQGQPYLAWTNSETHRGDLKAQGGSEMLRLYLVRACGGSKRAAQARWGKVDAFVLYSIAI